MERLYYHIGPDVEAFSTYKTTPLDFDVILPEHQAHGIRIAKIPDEVDTTYGVDALITDHPGVRIGVKTADCVPVLIYDPVHHAIGAVHSGWKGTLADITSHTLDRMAAEYGTCAADVTAVIGPCIHQSAFEVGDELYEKFTEAGYGDFCAQMPDYDTGQRIQWHIDLPGICRHQLERAGVRKIELRSECTYTEHDRFYSARRLKQNFDKQRILNCIKIQ